MIKKILALPKLQFFLPHLEKLTISKRHKFVSSIVFISLLFFYAAHSFSRFGFYIAISLAFLAGVLFVLSVYKDLKNNYASYVFVIPIIFFALAVGLCYFLFPSRILIRLAVTAIYFVGLYSLYLCQNINIVSSLRTIPLLSGARILSFIITIFSYLLLCFFTFSLHLSLPLTLAMIYFFSFVGVFQLVAVSLEKSIKRSTVWASLLALCLTEVAMVLWFWPSSPYLIAIFLTGFFYTTAGLSQVWLDRRLFRNVLWEYLWIAAGAFFILIFFTSWTG